MLSSECLYVQVLSSECLYSFRAGCIFNSSQFTFHCSRASALTDAQGPRGSPRVASDAATARAAHPSRARHEQHLHGAGAACQHERHVRGVLRAARSARDRPARTSADLRACRRARRTRPPAALRRLF